MDDLNLMKWGKKKRQRERREEKRKKRGQEDEFQLHSPSSKTCDVRRKTSIGCDNFQSRDMHSLPMSSSSRVICNASLRKKQDDLKNQITSSKSHDKQRKYHAPTLPKIKNTVSEKRSFVSSDNKSRSSDREKPGLTIDSTMKKPRRDYSSSDESSVDLVEDSKQMKRRSKTNGVRSNVNDLKSKASAEEESFIYESCNITTTNGIARNASTKGSEVDLDSVERIEQKSLDTKDFEASQESQRTCSLQPEKEGPVRKQKDSLWSDSEDDEKEVIGTSRRKEKKRKHPTVQPDQVHKQSTLKRNNFERKKLDDVEDDEQENIDAHELKPNFADPKFGPFELVCLNLKYSGGERKVSPAINRYLKNYQREGIAFMHGLVAEGQGGILGDDMGLGKTIQVISLISALLEKKGRREDEIELKRRRKINQEKVNRVRKAKERALREGTVEHSSVEELEAPAWSPILIIVPASVVENWLNEFHTWGHFAAVKFSGPSRDRAFEKITNGQADILVCCKSLFGQADDLKRIVEYKKWKLIVVDEYHQYKNFRTIAYRGLKSLKETCGAPLIGLTGTLMQNNHEELWSLVDLVNPGFLGTWDEFKEDAALPIKMGRAKTASEDTIDKSEEVRKWLTTRLKSFYIQRLKSIELRDYLPNKVERVLFCPLSPLQKQLYEHVLSLPDYTLLKYANSPCECGVNQKIFLGYKRMRTDAEKLSYQRNNRKSIVPRKECCHGRPLNPLRFEEGEDKFDPRAPLWLWQHQTLVKEDLTEEEEEEQCKKCPYCIGFAALDKLYKLSSHVALLQVPRHPDTFPKDSRAWKDAKKAFDFAEVAFSDRILDSLPGRSLLRQDGIMNDHANLSGKMKVLAEVLAEFDKRGDRVLVFSFSTQMLDLIQSFVKSQGYSFLRLDGSTPPGTRQGLVDKYQKDQGIFLFLISTKAGGLGLNLSTANVVIVFDVDFNPSNDEQSQDRAYRIGQKRDVLVIRLVSRGTVEEIKYIRQIYKVQLRKDTIGSLHTGGEDTHQVGEGPRVFRGVHGDKDRKGELFGMENLLKYKDGSFMDELWKSSSSSSSVKLPKGLERLGLRSNEDIMSGFEGISESAIDGLGGNIDEEKFKYAAAKINIEELGGDQETDVAAFLQGGNAKSHEDFLRADRGGAVFIQGDEGFEEEMGGCSQAVNFIMENAPVVDDEIAVTGIQHLSKEEDANLYTISPNRSLKLSLVGTHKATGEIPTDTNRNKELKAGLTSERAGTSSSKQTKMCKPTREDHVRNNEISSAKKKPQIEKVTGKGTTFTAKDLFVPRYTQKKRKKKK